MFVIKTCLLRGFASENLVCSWRGSRRSRYPTFRRHCVGPSQRLQTCILHSNYCRRLVLEMLTGKKSNSRRRRWRFLIGHTLTLCLRTFFAACQPGYATSDYSKLRWVHIRAPSFQLAWCLSKRNWSQTVNNNRRCHIPISFYIILYHSVFR